MEEIVYKPIGIFHCEQTQPVDSPRQGALAKHSVGVVELESSLPLQTLQDIEGFERIWLVYDFHNNKSWKPMVRPPRGADRKRGVFATRSPYRPNSIGLSCVRLEKIEGGRIYVSEHDLLDQTPILDIKPYVVLADSFPESKQGWLEELTGFSVEWKSDAAEKAAWLEEALHKPFRQILEQQLAVEPTNSKIKRVKKHGDFYSFHYRTWQVNFQVDGTTVHILGIDSHYTSDELSSQDDPYGDKEIHHQFLSVFPKV